MYGFYQFTSCFDVKKVNARRFEGIELFIFLHLNSIKWSLTVQYIEIDTWLTSMITLKIFTLLLGEMKQY